MNPLLPGFIADLKSEIDGEPDPNRTFSLMGTTEEWRALLSVGERVQELERDKSIGFAARLEKLQAALRRIASMPVMKIELAGIEMKEIARSALFAEGANWSKEGQT